MNPYRLTPLEAERMLYEYKRYHSDGPPYPNTPNAAKLRERDDRVQYGLHRRATS